MATNENLSKLFLAIYVTKIKKGSPEKNLEFLRLFENIIQVDYFNLEFGRKS